jgi:poly-gamma-glutamate capsule biosynthesis protein CapA/YwtB (metallophosphatase superfamily)
VSRLRIVIALLIVLVSMVGSALPPAPTAAAGAWLPFFQRGAVGPQLTLQAVGDIMAARGIGARLAAGGVDLPFSAVGRGAPLALLGADVVVGNLESPLTVRPTARPGPYRFAAQPAVAAALQRAGFTALSLANNHALDAGAAGLADSVAALQQSGIAALGAAADGAAAYQPLLIERAGLRLALFAANAVADPADRPDEAADWGRAWLDEQLLAAVSAAAAASDLVIVLPHWGEEYQAQPSAAQRDWAGRLAAAGADLIIGSHPHVLQPIEWLEQGERRTLVAYSLGNFVFDQAGRFVTSSSAVLQLVLDRDGVAAAAVAPVDLIDATVFPLDPAGREGRAVLAALALPLPPAPAAPAAAQHPYLRAWRWDGTALSAVPPARSYRPPAPPRQLLIDLYGDGLPRWARLAPGGLLQVGPFADPEQLDWQNEQPDWRVLRMAGGDLNQDGRPELTLLIERRDSDGVLVRQPYLLGARGTRLQIVWGGSAPAPTLHDLAVADLDGDGRDELIMLLGGDTPDAAVEQLVIAQWQRWLFVTAAALPLNGGSQLRVDDLDGDGRPEVVIDSRDG